VFRRYKCSLCNEIFDLKQELGLEGRYGPNVLAYITYQMIELRISQAAIAEALNRIFGFQFERHIVHRQKALTAKRYKVTYEHILESIVKGDLAHVDETKVTIHGKDEYVWVITNLESVFYFYTKTRAGDKLHEVLNDFQGVLVSDFYAVYDSFKCAQQKCLIHLIRDMNDDMRKAPFDDELKMFMREFAQLLQPIIETVDQLGLKTRFLRRHKEAVADFFEELCEKSFASAGATKYQKRLKKNHDKLFTFLDYDGVPWNNNNAEHAVKAFAMLRRVIRATSSETGIEDYLILLSICETCNCKGVDFLGFLLSEEIDIEEYIRRHKQ
jgi:hypothetical protein